MQHATLIGMSNILAIDVGGTKTLIASFDVHGTAAHKVKFATPSTYQDFLNDVSKTVQSLPVKKHSQCVIAMPGSLDRQHGVVKELGNLPWQNVPISGDLKQLLGMPIILENDAKLAGLSEAHLLPQYRKVLYITVSTGIGGVVIINGKIDPNSRDAEYGRMLLEHEGKLQLWEEFASGKAIVAKYGKRASDITDPQDWYVIARNIALGLVDVIAATTPDIVVIGGGVGTNFEKFGARLNEFLHIYEDRLLPIPQVVGAQRAEEAVIYGCYILANQ